MFYREFLTSIHEQLQPRHYLEIGVERGISMALAKCPAVGIDPAFSIQAELNNQVTLFRTTSDEYFNRPDPLAPTGGKPFDLAFIDGLHLFEFALRDFINTERHSSPRGVIVFDDVLPRSIDEAARERHTFAWTGDVYPVLAVLERYRPELIVLPVRTRPTGLLLVMGLDPDNSVLIDSYDEIMAEFRHPDPQPVPTDLLERTTTLLPERVLESPLWSVLSDPDQSPDELRRRLDDVVTQSLGAGFVRSPLTQS
ncbi:MAG TPA: class I SAM-dependent methyltransferase [Propionibacteriaceae bacterium]|nr:class I SAM-dependent methyltransferase [Propionibacteriaceae bacterium]